ncbi:serine-rich adhesin for platelets isoform X1 [Zeugodacus cucurbitae]|uniref:serine-rich adhesin for platelets isoform X1 n=2 Tax=Zeugodacus cucurbitae TaxID=28588 RepID=UPI0023D93D27|nr:serine-rich adhesin for platelets isoform X1 [Zeugodacus cucurbitae]
MFELEDYSSGYHDAILNKYAETSRPTLDLYISDSLQDMLDVDIRSEISSVVGGNNEFASLVNDLPSSFDHAIDAISSIHNSSGISSNHNSAALSSSTSSFSSWLGNMSGPSWSSSSNDYYVDLGACVDPVSVMPYVSSSLLHKSPKVNLNANSLQNSVRSPPPPSPNVNETKSHLTFSPAQLKVSAGAMRNEQLYSHIPKQIVAISSTVTAATTAPATLATNSALQRKNSTAVDTIKKDLGVELRKLTTATPEEHRVSVAGGGANVIKGKQIGNGVTKSVSSGNSSNISSSNISSSLLSSNSMLNSTITNTIKLAPGIGGLTFANSIAYNKLKQQSAVKTTTTNGQSGATNSTIMLKRERDSSPLQSISVVNANGGSIGGGQQHVTKLVGRNVQNSSFTPKSIASVHSPLMQHNSSNSIGSPSSSSSSSHSSPSTGSSGGSFTAGLIPITVNSGSANTSSSSASTTTITTISVKPLQQRIKVAPVESEFPKPAYSYSCLIAMALKNSRSGSLPVSEIYSFMCEHFPYFRTAPSGWKNSVRHNLSLNKCFEKIEKPATNGNQRKGCLWAMNPERISKMDEEVQKWSRKDPMGIRNAMVHPEHLDALERGEMKHGSSGDSDIELDSQSEIEETSDLEEQELDDTIVDNMFVEEDIEEDEMMSSGMVINNADTLSETGDMSNCGAGEDVVGMQQNRDFDIEVSLETHKIKRKEKLVQRVLEREQKVEDIYDAIDIEDDKETLQRHLSVNQSDIIELSPADLNAAAQSPKRARLNINYSIGPAGELEKQIQQQKLQQQHQQQQQQQQLILQKQHFKQNQQQQQQQQHIQHTIKQYKVQSQHIVVQTITNGSKTTKLQAINTATNATIGSVSGALSNLGMTQINGVLSNNRRKIQLVNRIV